MRTGGSFNTASTMATTVTTTAKETFSPPATVLLSPGHSPVPFLFGGLAAMLGFIAFALLILACSFRKLSGHLENREGGGGGCDRDLEAGEDKSGGDATKSMSMFEEKVLVIMAGDVNPTFLATPISSKASSFGDDGKGNEKSKQGMGHHHDHNTTTTITTTTLENRESQESQERNQ